MPATAIAGVAGCRCGGAGAMGQGRCWPSSFSLKVTAVEIIIACCAWLCQVCSCHFTRKSLVSRSGYPKLNFKPRGVSVRCPDQNQAAPQPTWL